jgi:hypothetical protein
MNNQQVNLPTLRKNAEILLIRKAVDLKLDKDASNALIIEFTSLGKGKKSRESLETFINKLNNFSSAVKRKIKVKRNKNQNNKPFLIHAKIQTTYIFDNDGGKNMVHFLNTDETIGPFVLLPNNNYQDTVSGHVFIDNDIDDILDYYFTFQDSHKTVEVLSYTIEHGANITENIPKTQQMMKSAFILKNDWLKLSKDIAQTAYDVTDNQCVDYQLANYFLNPPSGNPTKFLGGKKMSQEAIYNYFANHKIFLDVTPTSGRSIEMVEALCNDAKRSCYAYDDDKLFYQHRYVTEGKKNK